LGEQFSYRTESIKNSSNILAYNFKKSDIVINNLYNQIILFKLIEQINTKTNIIGISELLISSLSNNNKQILLFDNKKIIGRILINGIIKKFQNEIKEIHSNDNKYDQ